MHLLLLLLLLLLPFWLLKVVEWYYERGKHFTPETRRGKRLYLERKKMETILARRRKMGARSLVLFVCLFVYRHFLCCCENKPQHEENGVIISFYSRQAPWIKMFGIYSAYFRILRW